VRKKPPERAHSNQQRSKCSAARMSPPHGRCDQRGGEQRKPESLIGEKLFAKRVATPRDRLLIDSWLVVGPLPALDLVLGPVSPAEDRGRLGKQRVMR